jgi:type IX secretion system PorP/SprF family membrane protein
MTMKKIYTALWVSILGCTALHAQQVPQYSMYMLNPYAANPAYAGTENTLVATGAYRQQWSGLLGAPVTQHINAHLPLFAISSGVGLRIENNNIGAHTATSASLAYSYHLPLSTRTFLSIGAGAGYLQYALDGAILRAPEGTYAEPAPFDHNDDYLPLGKVQAGTPTVEAGLWLHTPRLSVGLGTQPVFAPVIESNADGNFRLKPRRNYHLYADYSLAINDQLLLRPAFLVKNDNTETQMEISFTTLWKENIFAGATYRGFTAKSKDAVVLLGGLKISEKTRLGYAYDIPLSALSAANRGSHELLLQYNLNRPIGAGKLPPITYNPRFF